MWGLRTKPLVTKKQIYNRKKWGKMRAVAGLNACSKGVPLSLFWATSRKAKGLAQKANSLCRKFRLEIPVAKKDWEPPATWTWA
jgi:hypothetical protein